MELLLFAGRGKRRSKETRGEEKAKGETCQETGTRASKTLGLLLSKWNLLGKRKQSKQNDRLVLEQANADNFAEL